MVVGLWLLVAGGGFLTTERARSRRYTKAGLSANLASEIATSEPTRFIEQARRVSIRRSQPDGFYRATGHERPRSRRHGISRKCNSGRNEKQQAKRVRGAKCEVVNTDGAEGEGGRAAQCLVLGA